MVTLVLWANLCGPRNRDLWYINLKLASSSMHAVENLNFWRLSFWARPLPVAIYSSLMQHFVVSFEIWLLFPSCPKCSFASRAFCLSSPNNWNFLPSLCISAHLTVLLLSNPVLNLIFLLLPITSSHSCASASDSTFNYCRYINISLTLTMTSQFWSLNCIVNCHGKLIQ